MFIFKNMASLVIWVAVGGLVWHFLTLGTPGQSGHSRAVQVPEVVSLGTPTESVQTEHSAASVTPERCLREGFRHTDDATLKADCINDMSRSGPYFAQANIRLNVAHSARVAAVDIVNSVRATARIFNQCDVMIDDVRLNTINVGGLYLYPSRADYFDMVRQYRKTDFPEVFLVSGIDARWDSRFAGVAFTSNSGNIDGNDFRRKYKAEPTPANRRKLTGTSMVLTEYLQDWSLNQQHRDIQLGSTLAHELFHLYADCACHTTDESNFMTQGAFTLEPTITPDQCSMLMAGVKRYNRLSRSGDAQFANY